MNLYLISQAENTDYDSYDSAVVAAVSEEEARNMSPDYDSNKSWNPPGKGIFMDWAAAKASPFKDWATSPANVEVRLLGVAAPGVERGVICASFNAG
jgi:hypothetical protein